MSAGAYDWTIEQGTSVDQVFTWLDASNNPISLTNWTARMQVRSTVASTTVLLDATTQNGRLILGGAAGTITVHLTAAETTAFAWSVLSGAVLPTGVYDIELVSPSGTVTRLLKGTITLDPEVTR